MLQRLRAVTKKRGVFLRLNTEEGFEVQKSTLKPQNVNFKNVTNNLR